ncbi:MAG: hypothetical protein ACRDT2_02160 [Natronosporangium sp.]
MNGIDAVRCAYSSVEGSMMLAQFMSRFDTCCMKSPRLLAGIAMVAGPGVDPGVPGI